MRTERPGQRLILLGVLLGAAACGGGAPDRGPPPPLEPPADAPLSGLVDPFVGTANDGQTFPGPQVPWGMASPSPHTTLSDPLTFLFEARASAGYLHGAERIHGFGQTHLSGAGCPDLGAPVLAPTVGPVATSYEGYGSAYAGEVAHAGYYRVALTDPGITVELTATPRVAVHRYFFPRRAGDANVLFDVGRSLSWRQDRGEVRLVSPSEVEGSVEVGLFCAESNLAAVYFVARASRPAKAMGTWQGSRVREVASVDAAEASASGGAGAFLRFETREGEAIEVRVGLSFVSVANARENLEAEAGAPAGGAAPSFEDLHAAAARAWQEALGRIRVEGGTEAERRRFFTALYHSLLQPSLASDVNGEYATTDGVGSDPTRERYTVFGLWDTYRGVHPLLTLVYPERQLAMLRTLADLTAELGRPPKWELLGDEVNMMVGDPLSIVVADSVAKGLAGFDAAALYPALHAAAHDPAHRPGLEPYLTLGYVPMEEARETWGPVSTTLEYALADACLARLAEAVGHPEDASALDARSRAWEHLYDPDTGLLRPRLADGTFLEPFDPDALDGARLQPSSGGPGYVEGTAWHYAFFVPHDTPALVARHGAGEFVQRLQALFDTGRFTLWNEPDIAYPYLFDYVPGEAWRAQAAARGALAQHFGDGPAGLPGNDDTGALSAWYVFSAMGLYPDAPGTPRYALGSPIFDRVEITLSREHFGGGTFVIEAEGNGPDHPYLQTAALDGQPLDAPFLTHAQVIAGGTLALSHGADPAPDLF